MSTLYTPFRYDYVGSFLRPAALKEARTGYEAGTITREELKAAEDAAIRDLVSKQKALGYHVITDGEFRRATWHLDFMWGFSGVGHHKTKEGLPFHGEQAMIDDTYLTGKVSLEGEHPFVEHYRFVKALEDADTVAKQTIPAPAQFLAQLTMPFARANTAKYYDDMQELVNDLVEGYHRVIRQLYDAGCRNIQFDDCTWGMLVDPAAKGIYMTDEKGLKKIQEQYLAINNRAIEGKPEDLVINTHICRGNYHSTFASRGAYDEVAAVLFAKENVNAFYLEYDDARSGGFAPLASVSGDKKVVLGLVTTKSPKLEVKESVIARIREAAKYVPLERLYLSPQCGFASCEIGNKLTEEEQWAKLKLVKEIAEEVWGTN
ncbi:MAG: 5-methyltetrahydropteroyltriglutamate--homocysteine S-methyltransferase [Lachnospiraceae bacterium]|jgi:methionine synthase II (cobalamin-independent)|nr:5-methyltetrahydropteroyltriglutamate--homocysteine S-methyltransferase [Lachnospiraceae bacterium]MCI1398014.1 5-methyltetrahydropteroyltriglutamate--homocysteine S-methyltransferase [Lachnospiraceae bacterium]MCI1424137.1 5-methyltetrahydropteroyltriglutamate--homocysteine S-methyltransferase [Lachnospiraceae bacterium]MCI1452939.1 5-methyltetrahydropteroyltriglutamate--homocysteine S-methyltransferase [Lachnospiraceae bacterium]